MLPLRADRGCPKPGRLALALAAALAWPSAQAQTAAGTSTHSIVPYASLQQILTDNYSQAAVGASADAVTRATAGVSLRSRSGRVQGYADYSLSGLLYAQHGDSNQFEHRLAADVDVEWFERQGFLRVAASVQQVARSAFGAQPQADSLPGSNTTELRSLRLSPRWQGLLPAGLQVQLQADASASNASDSQVGDSRSSTLSVQVSPHRPGPLNWSVNAVHLESDHDLTRGVRSSRAYGTLGWVLPDLDLSLSAQAGAERSNLSSAQPRDDSTWGVGLQWVPSPRTRAVAQFEERGFGRTHQLLLEYRTPRTVWQLSDARTIATGGSTLEIGVRGRAFDILFAEFASVEPDFAKRVALVDAELARLGIAPGAVVFNTFLRSAVTIDDRQELSFGWRGPRFSVLLNHARTVSRRLDLALVGQDDLDRSSRVHQRASTLVLAHRLTPEMTATLTTNTQSARGDLASQRNRQHGLVAQLGGRLMPQDSWSVALRRVWYQTSGASYSENALVATYGRRF